MSPTCAIDSCGQPAPFACAGCGIPLCDHHRVVDYQRLPGGHRGYCPACDAQRRELYQAVRFAGPRLVGLGAAGAIGGSIVGIVLGRLISPDSFTHTIFADGGFIAGLALALAVTLTRSTARNDPR